MRSDHLSRRLNRNVALLVAASGAALTAELAVPQPTGNGMADVMWSVIAGAAAGVVCLSAVTALRPKWKDVTRALIAVVMSTFLFWMRLPGPFGAETAVSVVLLTVMAIFGWVKRPRSRRRWRTRTKRRLRLGALVAVGAGVLGLYLSLSTASQMRSIMVQTAKAAGGSATDFQSFELDRGANKVRQAADDLARLDSVAGGIGGRIMALMPVVGHQRSYALNVAKQVRDLATRAEALARLYPQERLAMRTGNVDLARAAEMEKSLNDMVYTSEQLTAAVRDASPWLIHRVAGDINSLARSSEKFHGTLKTTLDLVRALPWIMGEDSPRSYAVTVMSASETSPAGGTPFMTGLLSARNGALQLTFDTKYDPKGSGATALTATPDFPRAAETAWQHYSRTSPSPVGGIISIDLRAMAQVAAVTGPIPTTWGNRPGVLDPVDVPAALAEGTHTKDIVNALTRRLFSIDPVQWRKFVALWGPMVENGNIRMWFTDFSTSELVRAVNGDGAIGDPSSVADVGVFTSDSPTAARAANLGNALSRTVDHQVTLADDGTVTAATHVTLANDARSDNPLTMVLYSMLDCTATVDGTTAVMSSGREGAWVVHTLYVTVRAKGSATVHFRCTGSEAEQGTGVGTPRFHGQTVARDDAWSVKVTARGTTFSYAGPLNSNSWHSTVAS